MPSATPTPPVPAFTRVSWVLLTMGDRPDELEAAIASIPRAENHETEVVVVANGASGVRVDDGVILTELADNVGVPAGRNHGAELASGQILVFLDDDALIADQSLSERLVEKFGSEPDLAVVGFRIADPNTGITARRHVPRPGNGDATRSGDVTSFLGGACAVRRDAFDQVGGLPGAFFYALEETDFAWRCIDRGWRVFYDAAALVHHPKTDVARHGGATRLTARNRVLLARRLLPWPLVPAYIGNWFVITSVRSRSRSAISEHWAGTREGWAATVDRTPMKWRTVWRLTKLGRPPLY